MKECVSYIWKGNPYINKQMQTILLSIYRYLLSFLPAFLLSFLRSRWERCTDRVMLKISANNKIILIL